MHFRILCSTELTCFGLRMLRSKNLELTDFISIVHCKPSAIRVDRPNPVILFIDEPPFYILYHEF